MTIFCILRHEHASKVRHDSGNTRRYQVVEPERSNTNYHDTAQEQHRSQFFIPCSIRQSQVVVVGDEQAAARATHRRDRVGAHEVTAGRVVEAGETGLVVGRSG